MGYYMWQRESRVFIPANKVQSATNAINSSSQINMSFEDAIFKAGFETERNKTGDVVGLIFTGEKLTDQYDTLRLLAPFVKEGSYLEFIGEDFLMWRWVFIRGQLVEIIPDIVWDMEIKV